MTVVGRKKRARNRTDRIAVVGPGNMGQAIIRGLVEMDPASRSHIITSGRDRRKVKEIAAGLGIRSASTNGEAVEGADVVLLAVKPQILLGVLDEIRPSLKSGATVISIAAGVPTSLIEETLGETVGVVRAMPNVAASVRASATAFCNGAHSRVVDASRARKLLGAVGSVVEVEEYLMDAVTGLSGTGPLYLFLILEGLSDAGVKVGLSRTVSTELAIQTLVGSAQLVKSTGEHPAKLRDLVTSPGGTAITALHSLERSGLKAMLFDAVEAATLRSAELGTRWKRLNGPQV